MTNTTKNTTTNIAQMIFDPPTLASYTTANIRNAKTDAPSLSLGIPNMSDFVMARKNKVIGLLADTSQGKTSVMSFMSRNMAEQIDAEAGEIGIYITWEDTVEDFGINDIANLSKIPLASLYHGDVKEHEFKRMVKAATERARSPLWVIGQSESSTHLVPRLTMSDACEAVDYIVNKQNKTIRFVMLDYLQRISRDDVQKERDSRLQFSAVMDRIGEFAKSFHPATFIASQVARSKVEAHKWRQPQIHWAMETANFEHTCDGAFSLWMPIKSKDAWSEGDCLFEKQNPNDKAVFVRDETMLIEILKQKKAKSGQVAAVDFLPEYNMLVPYGTAEEVRKKIQAEVQNV